ncbi:gephyrin-like molybdotransferase Glp [Caulobacter sp. SLTY]|uniref:molybdopterin molybdotransferase MoeA n=1 Tax=Caulobacter sp. SLTY TaxID=2683262 RepID=UPI003211F52F
MSSVSPLKNLPVEDARARMLAGAGVLRPSSIPLTVADGAVLAQDILAQRDQPPFDASAMDGWAVRRTDAGEGAVLSIAGESAAGRGHEQRLQPGQAVRIFTGAPVPAGADLVVIQEEAQRDGDAVRLTHPPGQGSHIRPAGGDFRAGQILLPAGTRLDPWRLSLVAAAGYAMVPVADRPRVAILATGEELVPPGGSPGPFQIYESGSAGLAPMLTRWGAIPVRLTPAGDDLAAIQRAVNGADADLVVTIGGASVGDYDLVKPALAGLGLKLAVETVNVRPGKPTWFGTLGDGRRVLGLPGNPASAFVCAELFLKPLVLALQGAAAGPAIETARLAQPLAANGPREHWMRAVRTPDGVRALPDQDSSLVTVFAAADALLRRAAHAPAVEAGGMVEILRLDRA